MKRRGLLLWAALPALAQAEVEVNTATRAELESLPGLGPALVQRLLAARPFKDCISAKRFTSPAEAVKSHASVSRHSLVSSSRTSSREPAAKWRKSTTSVKGDSGRAAILATV